MITIELTSEQAEVIRGFMGELLENPAEQNLPALLNVYTQINNQLETKQVCEDCEEEVMDDWACPNNRGYCLDCCACPEHGKACEDCGELTKASNRLCPDCFDQWLNQASRGGR